MCFFKKNNKFKVIPPNIVHPELAKIIRWQFEQYMKNKN